jgi:hypothetical protein
MSESAWKQKSDEELLMAAAQSDEYNGQSQQEIRDELERRNIHDLPPFPLASSKWLANDAIFWRGTLGGAIGCFLYLIYLNYRYRHQPGFYLFLAYSPLWIILGGAIGMIVGLILWVVYIKSKRKPGVIARSLVGGCIIFITVQLLGGAIIDSLVGGMTVGSLSGAMARPKSGKQPTESEVR